MFYTPEFVNGAVDAVGMVGFALAGLLATQNHRVDPVGVFVAVFSTAFGGGILRDLMLDLRPFYWMSNVHWLWMVFVLTVFAPAIIRRMNSGWRHRIYIWADAIGLAFFAVNSTATAWQLGHGAFVSVLIGVATGVFGGLMRDVFCHRLPAVLSDKQPYAMAAFCGCWFYLFLIEWVQADPTVSLWTACLAIIAVRMLSFRCSFLRVAYDDEIAAEKPSERS